MRSLLIATFLVLCSAGVEAQARKWREAPFRIVYLKNGATFRATEVFLTPTHAMLTLKRGKVRIRRSTIKKIEVIHPRRFEKEKLPPFRPLVNPASSRSSGRGGNGVASASGGPARSGDDAKASPLDLKASPLERSSKAEIGRQVVEAITSWNLLRVKDHGDLERQLMNLGPDAVPFLCNLAEGAPESIPLEPVTMVIALAHDTVGDKALSRLLAANEPRHREAALQAMIKTLRKEFIPQLVLALGDSWPGVSVPAGETLAGLVKSRRHPGVVSSVAAQLRYSDHKYPYAEFLGRVATRRSRATLEYFLDLDDGQMKIAALHGLRLLGDRDVGGLAWKLLEDDSVAVVKEACLFLGKIEYRAAVGDLIELLRSRDLGLAYNALWALRAITDQHIGADPGLWEFWLRESGWEENSLEDENG